MTCPLLGSTLKEVADPIRRRVDFSGWESRILGQSYKEIGTLSKDLPCVCLNPDKWMLTPQGLAYGVGKIAEHYESAGGKIL